MGPLDARFGDLATRLRGVKRNVVVALGNWLASVDNPPEKAVAALSDAVADEDSLVREHAAWALDRMR